MSEIYDAAVLGSGPAGSATAMALAKAGWQVLVIEKASLPREKVCGGFLGPENRPFLESNGVLDELLNEGAQKVTRLVLTADRGVSVEMPMDRKNPGVFGLGVSRSLLDRVLLRSAERCGVKLMADTRVVRITDEGRDGLLLSWQNAKSKSEGELRVRHLVDAMGVHPKAPKAGKGFYGVYALFEGVREMKERVYLHFVRGAHVGINQFEKGMTNICYGASADFFNAEKGNLDKLYVRLLSMNPFLDRQLAEARRVTPWKGIYIPGGLQPRFFEGHAFCAGDAVTYVNPVVGGGMTQAIRCGTMLGELLAQGKPGAFVTDQTVRLYEKAWKKKFLLKTRVSRWLGELSHESFWANAVLGFMSRSRGLLNYFFDVYHSGT